MIVIKCDLIEYRNFTSMIEKAKVACSNSGQDIEDHFVELHEMVDISSKAKRELEVLKLSCYVYYLIVQNTDPSKDMVALV